MLTISPNQFFDNRAITLLTHKRVKAYQKMLLGFWLSFFTCCPFSIALADNIGLYAGIGITNTIATEQNIDSTKSGFRLTGGYSFNKYFAAEIGLFNVGDHTKLGMKGNGSSLSALGKYPLNDNFSIFGELGAVRADLEVDENNTTVDRTGEESLQDGTDTGLFYAYGLTYDMEDWTVALKISTVDTDADLAITSLNIYRYF
jgi:hypothetical protein